MYERLKRLYNEGRIHEAELQNAVAKGWITEEQMKEIIEGNESVDEPSTEKE